MGKKSRAYTGPRVKDTDTFIRKAVFVHGDKYSYEKSIYTKAIDKIAIVCPHHGVFEMQANNHLQGQGCQKCAGNQKKGTGDFIREAVSVHGNKYSYANSVYEAAHKKIQIDCPDHGAFFSLPTNHIKGHGCPMCARVHMSHGSYNRKTVERFPDRPVIRYLAEFVSENERFFKIGLTTDIRKRFNQFPSCYQTTVLETVNTTLREGFDFEQSFLRGVERHIPDVRFGGYTECFK